MAEEVTMWRASDGSIHDTPELAEEQDLRLEMIEYFDDHKLYGRYEGCDIGGEQIVEFIDEHKEILTKYLTIRWKEITQ